MSFRIVVLRVTALSVVVGEVMLVIIIIETLNLIVSHFLAFNCAEAYGKYLKKRSKD